MAADLGAAIGPLAGAWLYQAAGPRAPFVANAVVLAVCAVVLGAWLHVPARPPAPVQPAASGKGSPGEE
jgi:MFS family permease